MAVQAAEVVERAEALIAQAYADTGDPAGLAHAQAVGELLADIGCDSRVVAAGLLHDVVEDTPITADTVSRAFGTRIAELVAAMTEDARITDERVRKQTLRSSIGAAGHTALLIFAADKLARVRDADASGAPIEPVKLEHYRRSLEMLIACDVRSPYVNELDRRLALRRSAA